MLFGTMYFLQGVVEPTDGLLIQPVRAILKSWHEGPAKISSFAALLTIPWMLKPLYGLLTDFVPLFGWRRKSYLLITGSAATVGFLSLYWFPPATGAYSWLLLTLLLPTVSVAFGDVVVDALMVERGQPTGITGRLQSVQWASIYAASVLTGIGGGYLSGHALYRLAFLICASASALSLVITLFFVHEPPHHVDHRGWKHARKSLAAALRSRRVRSVCMFFFLFEFNPCSTTVQYLHMTVDLQYSEDFYGVLRSIVAVASVAACATYSLYSQRMTLRQLVHLSIALGVISTLVYAALGSTTSAYVVSFVFGFTYMTAMLIQLHLAAQACPPAAAGTVFALIMALSNLSSSLATGVGGNLYEQGMAWWGAVRQFQRADRGRRRMHIHLLAAAAGTAANCWTAGRVRTGLNRPARRPRGCDGGSSFVNQLRRIVS